MGLAGLMLAKEMEQRTKGELPAHFDADGGCLKRGFFRDKFEPEKPEEFYEIGDVLGKPSKKSKANPPEKHEVEAEVKKTKVKKKRASASTRKGKKKTK